MRKILIPVVALLLAAPVTARAQSASGDGAGRATKLRYIVQQAPPPPPPQPARPRPFGGRGGDAREEQQETFTKTVRLGSNGVLDIWNLVGNIEIVRGSGNDATIEVTKVARARTVEEAKELLPLVNVEVNARGDRAEIRTQYPPASESRQRRNINVMVHFKITAPQGTRIIAQSISGNLKVSDIRGEIAATTTSGNVSITNAARVSAAKTTSGNVELTNIDSDVGLDAGTVSGDVTLRDVKARRMKLSTVTGHVIAQNIVTEILGASSFNGNIEVIGPLTKGGRYELKAHSGNVKLQVGGGTGFEVEASSWSGTVQSDFTFNGSSSTPESGRFRHKVVKGVVGDGGALVVITTFSGNVILVKK